MEWGGVGWGVIAFVTTARHDVMLRYAFVTTARHDVMLRYAFVSTARHDGKRRNGLLFKYIRSHQCRWEHTGFDLLTATGEAVRSLMR